MANITYPAGIATAYGAAVRGGYTGTYEDFCRQQAQYAESAAAVEQAKTDAEAAASAADTSKTAAAGSASAAATSAGQASTSETNAANSATAANTSKNAAATSATEAENSATAAAGSASDAQTSADDAQASAEAAAQSAASVDVHTDGNYPEMTVGTSEQLLSTQYVTDKTPYLYRTTGGSSDVGNREYVRGITGGTVAWNQLCKCNRNTESASGVTKTNNGDGSVTLNGTATVRDTIPFDNDNTVLTANHVYFMSGYKKVGSNTGYIGLSGFQVDKGNGGLWKNTNPYETLRIRVDISQGDTFDNVKMTPQFFDLTQMFGTTIADYIYGLEQANAGAGVAWFRKLFPNDYYPYDAGTIKSVEGVSAHKTVGFNQFDGETETGYFDVADGTAKSGSNFIRSKNPIKCVPNTVYHYYNDGSGSFGAILCYDANDGYIGYVTLDGSNNFTTLANTHLMRFYTNKSNTNICINLSWSGTHNGEYKPYEKHSYALDSSLTLRGIPKLDASNNLYYDGDVYPPSGEVARRYGSAVVSANNVVAIGTTSTGIKYVQVASMPFFAKGNTFNILTTKGYTPVSAAPSVSGCIRSMGQDYFYVYDNAFTDLDTAKSLLTGMGIVCELATPTTESADPYTEIQICDDWGTEEYVSTSIVPVGHTTDYPANLRDKLQHLPDLASADGNYIVSQSGTQMTLAPLPIVIPAPPTTDGTYTFRATVSNGVPTLSWVEE